MKALRVGAIHVVGAALGGALIGAILGSLGELARLQLIRPWFIAAAGLIALFHATRRRKPRIGRRWQVPRSWGKSMPPDVCFLLWGVLLGCGVLTVIPYSFVLVALGGEATAGVLLAAASGAVLGGIREAVTLAPVLRRDAWPDLGRMMDLVESMKGPAERLNVLCLALGTTALVGTAVLK